MPYIGQGKKDFWISRLFDPATNSLKIIKESPEKYKVKLIEFGKGFTGYYMGV